MAENTNNRLTGMLLSKSRRAQYLKVFAVLAACVVVAVAIVLHQNGVAMTHKEQVLTCPVTGAVAHTHDESCYDKDGNLVCTLPERELHTHTDACYTETRELTCGLEESDGHKHTEACYDANTGELICGLEESEGHHHTDACYTITRELTCGLEEITETHVHGPGCFTTVEVTDAMPAQEFNGELKDQDNKTILKVEVKAPEGAFPANTTMQINAINPDDVKQTVDEAVAQKSSDAKVTDIQAIAIKFFNQAGEEIEPAKDITVRFISDIIAQNDNSYVVHVNDDGKGDVVDSLTNEQLAERNQQAGNNELYIDASQFSPYVLVGTSTSLQHTFTASDGNSYTITVDCPAEAGIPSDASLQVTEIVEGSTEYDTYINKVNESVDDKVTFARFFDITIVSNGVEQQPKVPVSVRVELNKDADKLVDDVKAVHIANNEADVINAQLEGDTVKFNADGFSVYAIVGTEPMTVDYLTADGKTLKVTVEFDEREHLPKDAKLEITEVQEGDEGWADRSARLANVLYENLGNVIISDERLLNITLLSNAGKYDPEYPVKVKIKYDKALDTKLNIEGAIEGEEGQSGISSDGKLVNVGYTTNDNAEILDTNSDKDDNGIKESTFLMTSLAPLDTAYAFPYETRSASAGYGVSNSVTGTNGIAQMLKAQPGEQESNGTLQASGMAPDHNKWLTDNENGTYTIGLDVKGAADVTAHAPNANVLIIYDKSSSMRRHLPDEHGAYGQTGSSTYTELYKKVGNKYELIGNEPYTGDLYIKSWNNTYSKYNGLRYGNITRAAESEQVVYNFVESLYSKSNGNNIQTALLTFHLKADEAKNVNWTSNKEDITNKFYHDGVSYHDSMYSQGTNWDDALREAKAVVQKADNDPTFVVFITDGEPSVHHGALSSISGDEPAHYEEAKEPARELYQVVKNKNSKGDFFGVYAYGDGDKNSLPALMEYALTGAIAPGHPVGRDYETENYYNAADTQQLTNAINSILEKIIEVSGVSSVQIVDGTTYHVETSSTRVEKMLDVDAGTFKYYLSIPVNAAPNNKYTFTMKDVATGNDVVYTVVQNNTNIIITWGDNKRAEYNGSIENGKMAIEWTSSTAFYNKTPPQAVFSADTGEVTWDLNTVGTLLDGVTYSVTFECYPSQWTLDLIASLKNGTIAYNDLDNSIKQYLSSDYKLKTNTTATLTYTDTRTDDGPQTVNYNNPAPQPVDASQTYVKKEWSNALDDRQNMTEVSLHVTQDGNDWYQVNLGDSNDWQAEAWISYGIITVDGPENDPVIKVKEPGHDYTFQEDDNTRYHWEIEADTVRPMQINNNLQDITILKLIEPNQAPEGLRNNSKENARATQDDKTYYKFKFGNETKYYVVRDDNSALLTAINHRRSYLDVRKDVEGMSAPNGDTFDFTMKVENPNATGNADDGNTDTDEWVWFSIGDTSNGFSQVKDASIVQAQGLRYQLNSNEIVTSAPNSEDFNGYFCVPSGTQITVQMQNKYSLRFTNLPVNTTYAVSESETEDYSFVKIEGEREYKDQGEWKTQKPVGTVSGSSINGKIEYSESAYKVSVTNKSNAAVIKLKKVDENGQALDGAVFDLYKKNANNEWVPTAMTNITVSGDNNPFNLSGCGTGDYKLTETTTPDGYVITKKDVYFKVAPDSNKNLTVELTNQSNGIEGVTLIPETNGSTTVYIITVPNTPGSEMPRTGGIGTTAIYATGAALVGIAAYGLVSKKLRNNL